MSGAYSCVLPKNRFVARSRASKAARVADRLRRKGSSLPQSIVWRNRKPGLACGAPAKPRGSRIVSGEPRSWMTVEKRTATGVCTPGARRKSAQVRLETSCVTCSHQSVIKRSAGQVGDVVRHLQPPGGNLDRKTRNVRAPSRAAAIVFCTELGGGTHTAGGYHAQSWGVARTQLCYGDLARAALLWLHCCGYVAMAACSTADTMPRQCPFAL